MYCLYYQIFFDVGLVMKQISYTAKLINHLQQSTVAYLKYYIMYTNLIALYRKPHSTSLHVGIANSTKKKHLDDFHSIRQFQI